MSTHFQDSNLRIDPVDFWYDDVKRMLINYCNTIENPSKKYASLQFDTSNRVYLEMCFYSTDGELCQQIKWHISHHWNIPVCDLGMDDLWWAYQKAYEDIRKDAI